jgi:hypothetical protein
VGLAITAYNLHKIARKYYANGVGKAARKKAA